MNPTSYVIYAIILIVAVVVSWILALIYRKNIVEKKNAESAEKAREILDNAVKEADGRPCPPLFLGIGIGGNFETSCLMAKEALLREGRHENPVIANLEEEIKAEVNKLYVGPMGLGGDTTVLDVFINTVPCHIASLPVALNIQCHANRHVEVII